MLRDRKLKSAGRIPAGRWFVLAVIGITSVVLVGMKPPPNRAIGQDVGVRVDSKDGSRPGQYELKFVSDDGGLFFAARPNELLASNQLTEIAKQIQELPQVTSFTEELGVSLKDIEQLIVGFDQTMNEPNSVYMRSVKPMGNSTSPRLGKPAKLSGADILESPSGSMCIWKPDAHSLVFGSKRNVERCIQGRQIERKLTETELWKKLMDRPLLIIGESRIARKWVGEMRLEQSPFALIISSLRPILDEAEVFGVAASMKEDFSIEAMAKSTDTKGATIIQETSQAAMVLVRNGLRELGRTLTTQPNTPVLPTEAKTTIESLLSVGSKLADMAKFQIDGTTVRVTTSIKSNMIPVASIAAALGASRKGAVRSLSANNMKQIALAFHNFHDVHRQFPHTTKSPVPGHSQPVSWRVMILPYIEQVALYEAYRFDEPWDGPSNIKLLSKMPAIYRHPSSAPGSTETSYAILTGEQTMFPPSKPSKLAEITDGTSNTIMTVETKSSIPWTKPEDLDYASDKPLPVLGGFADEGFHAGFADGSVRFMSRSTKELMLRALFSARGGEVVNQ